MAVNVTYKVVFDGELLPGHQRDIVQSRLAELFGVDAAAAAKLFAGKPHKVKSKLDLPGAKKYARALGKLGALAYIEQEIVETIQPVKPLKTVKVEVEPVEQTPLEEQSFTDTGSFDVSAVRAYFEQQEDKKAELEKTGNHDLFSLDELDDALAAQNYDEPSGVQNVLDAQQLSKLLNSK